MLSDISSFKLSFVFMSLFQYSKFKFSVLNSFLLDSAINFSIDRSSNLSNEMMGKFLNDKPT